MVLQSFNLIVANGWSDKSFMALIELLKNMLSKDNKIPNCTWKVKKILCLIYMDYETIHACLNDYIFYQNEYKALLECSKCRAS